MVVTALDPTDPRAATTWVAGPGALLVAKVHKIAERVDAVDRVRDKDALDILRLLRAVDTDLIVERVVRLQSDELSIGVTDEAIDLLPELFATSEREGVTMAVRAAGTSEDPATIAGSLVALVDDLAAALRR